MQITIQGVRLPATFGELSGKYVMICLIINDMFESTYFNMDMGYTHEIRPT